MCPLTSKTNFRLMSNLLQVFINICLLFYYLNTPIAPLWFLDNPPILHDSESSYSFYLYLPLCLLLGYGLWARPALNMYVYKRLVSAVGIPQTWYQLGFLSSRATLGLFLLITQSPDLSLLFLCVFVALRRKPVQYERVLVVSLGVWGSTIPTTTWGVLVCTCRHQYGTG